LPESHADLSESPAAAVEGLAGTFIDDAGDRLEVQWDGLGREVSFVCAGRDNVAAPSAGDEPPYYELVTQLHLVTADGDFDETLAALIAVRQKQPDGTLQVSGGDNLSPGSIQGAFTPPQDAVASEGFGRLHWRVEFRDGGWQVDLAAYGTGGGDLMPFWERTLELSAQ
jgi:hypothetical protein